MARIDHYYFDDLAVARGFKMGVDIVAEELIDYHLNARATHPKLKPNNKYEVKVTITETP